MLKKILVTGGAGYIGSHTCLKLKELGMMPVVYDNLVYGHRESVIDWDLFEGDLADENKLDNLFRDEKFDAVIHFAAYAYVGESVKNPEKYYINNVGNGLCLLGKMLKYNVKNLIFSSTCATYGEPCQDLINENHPQNPINPYGESKLIFEKILKNYRDAYGLNSISLRYFNAAGAEPQARIGESHDPETHLIPLVLKAATGENSEITIFGDDYQTDDGSCIRDYIHVMDLAEAHILALNKLFSGNYRTCYNLGNGRGFSVKEVINCAREVTGCQIKSNIAARRPGDPARLVADATLAKKDLGWNPNYVDLRDIILTAWKWEQKKRF